MEAFVATYGTPDSQDATIGGANALVGTSQGYITSGYLGCNTDMAHDYSYTFNNTAQVYQTGNLATKNCISRYGARDLIGNFGEWFDGYYENTNNSTTRQRSGYWGTADKITTVISDAILGYAFPTGFQAISVSDWDYQNLLPKTYILTTIANPNPKFFMDAVLFNASTATRVVYIGVSSWANGSNSGRFNKGFNWAPTSANAVMGTRCAITSP